MTVPKLPPFDALTTNSAWKESVLQPDGTPYPIFTNENFVTFVRGLRTQRDVVNTHDIRLGDHKTDLDEHAARLIDLEQRVAAVEARPASPFPGS